MNGDLKTVLQVLFLVALIWLLAALIGVAPGAELRIGTRQKGRRRRQHRVNPFRFVSNGMVGELVNTPGYAPMAVGWPGTVI